jgi:hypothetical protein
MALSGTPAEHCVRAQELKKNLLDTIRESRRDISIAEERKARNPSDDLVSYTRRRAHLDVSVDQKALMTEMRWADESCKVSLRPALISAQSIKRDAWDGPHGLGFLPEFGNIWPAYLAVGSIALWLWNAKKKA